MTSAVLVGTQWGDEGKGKICDLIAPDFDCVVRYQGGNNIGTTKRGIGPCYQDKMARIGIRMQDLLDEDTFRDKLATALDRVNPQLEKLFGLPNYAARVNGLTDIALTKLDVLSEFETIKVCVAYDVDGERYTTVPEHSARFANARPIFEELPQNAKDYVAYIEKLAHTRISIVAVGPDRERTIMRSW